MTSSLESHENIIRHIDLSYNELTDVGIEIFSKLLEQCTNLESINLQGNRLQALSAEKLALALSGLDSLRYLNLENNEIATDGVIALTKNLLFSSNEEKGRSLE